MSLLFGCSGVSDSFATPWAAACHDPLSMGFPQQEYWSGLPFPSPWAVFPTQGLNPHLLHWQVDFLPLSHLEAQSSRMLPRQPGVSTSAFNYSAAYIFEDLLTGHDPPHSRWEAPSSSQELGGLSFVWSSLIRTQRCRVFQRRIGNSASWMNSGSQMEGNTDALSWCILYSHHMKSHPLNNEHLVSKPMCATWPM